MHKLKIDWMAWLWTYGFVVFGYFIQQKNAIKWVNGNAVSNVTYKLVRRGQCDGIYLNFDEKTVTTIQCSE
jgi:hypothetical protein